MMENERGRMDLLTQKQIDWCDEHCDFDWFVKDDGKVYSNDESIYFKNKDSIDSFHIKFGNCKYFSCYHCDFLESLEGASERVSRNFDCSYCESLKSLKGAPIRVGGFFSCSYCESLKSLEGASKSVGGNFSCFNCDSLVSLEGVPENIGRDFNCFWCDSLELIDDLKNTKINRKICYNNCLKLKKYDLILSDKNWFHKWQKSDLTADEFMKEWNGYLEAKKYGI